MTDATDEAPELANPKPVDEAWMLRWQVDEVKEAEEEVSVDLGATKAFELALRKEGKENYVLRLYVSGMTPNSLRAIENTRMICSNHLEGQYHLEIIDIYQQPAFAKEGEIVAAPTLVKELPPPLRRFIGNMSNTDRILAGLALRVSQ